MRTKDFQINIEKICRERNDSWSTNVLSRIQFITRNVTSTFAPEKVYHRAPKQDVQIAFQKTMDYLIEHEDEQITVIELIDKMSEFCGSMAIFGLIPRI